MYAGVFIQLCNHTVILAPADTMICRFGCLVPVMTQQAPGLILIILCASVAFTAFTLIRDQFEAGR